MIHWFGSRPLQYCIICFCANVNPGNFSKEVDKVSRKFVYTLFLENHPTPYDHLVSFEMPVSIDHM